MNGVNKDECMTLGFQQKLQTGGFRLILGGPQCSKKFSISWQQLKIKDYIKT